MKKTLVKKTIKGRGYYYLVYRRGKRLVNVYLGRADSKKYKNYLVQLTQEGATFAFDKAKHKNFAKGCPIVYSEDGFLVYEYRSGAREFLNSKLQVMKVELPNG